MYSVKSCIQPMFHFKLKRLCLCGGKFFIVDGFLLLKRVNFVLNGTKLLAAYLILLKFQFGNHSFDSRLHKIHAVVTVKIGSENTTLPLAQLNFQTQFGTNYNLAFASYLLSLIPILVFYIICQKQIIGGVANGAVKG